MYAVETFLPVCQTGVLAVAIFMLPLLGYGADSWLIEEFCWKGPLEAILSRAGPTLELHQVPLPGVGLKLVSLTLS